MVTDTFYFFTKDASLLADMSSFVRSMNASLLSIWKEYPTTGSDDEMKLMLEEDRQWVCYEC